MPIKKKYILPFLLKFVKQYHETPNALPEESGILAA
jgi:hypothetical protein